LELFTGLSKETVAVSVGLYIGDVGEAVDSKTGLISEDEE
jgi:hypothetical protein